MIYIDRIYGRIEITEPVLLDLMGTAAVQRLHGVLQHGISGLIGITRATTRFEHSMGVMILVRRLDASLKEQIAALLHDVSHTAFSHVMDYVFNGYESQSYHEDFKEMIVANSDLPEVLSRHGYDWHDFLYEEHFGLLEQPAPALCADRLDYFLRDSLDLGLGVQADIDSALQHLATYHGRIVVDDLNTARWMGYTFIAADRASWANLREVGLYELTAQAIRYALTQGILQEKDIWGTDEQVWAQLSTSSDAELHELLKQISPVTQFVRDEAAPDFRISTKLRTIDPDVLVEGQPRPLSSLDSEFAGSRAKYLEEQSGKWPIRVEKRED